MNLIPNPSDARYVKTLREIVDLIRESPQQRRDVRSLANRLERHHKVLRNQLARLEDGGVLARGLARVSSGAEAFVFSVVASYDEIEAFMLTILMSHARPLGDQRSAIRMPGVSPNKGKKRAPDAIERAKATVALKAQLRQAGGVRSYSDLPREFFGAGPAVHAMEAS